MGFFKRNKNKFSDIETNPEKEAINKKLKGNNHHTIEGKIRLNVDNYILCDDAQITGIINLFKKCFEDKFKTTMTNKGIVTNISKHSFYDIYPDGSLNFKIDILESHNNPIFLKNYEENDPETDRDKYINVLNEAFFEDFLNFIKSFDEASEGTLFISKIKFRCQHCKKYFYWNRKTLNTLR